MKNWGVDTKKLKKEKEKFSIWKLEQIINFGADGEKISTKELKRAWNRTTLDPAKRKFLGFLIWGRKFLTKTK
ncbi:MAG: hypothetical protein A3J72_04685 [Nitrospirae bacterium RIFCSPHIGHO2_02_FULL_40_19]|nr:MAG: hypothetical protein A3J72_04685 [Nitrospirae bacterium RIFCSPHIGHO2_02_FULL_40_19]